MHPIHRRTRTIGILVAATLLAPASALAVPGPGSHYAGDGGATGRQVADGPATAGLAWRTELGVALNNERDGSSLSSNGLAILQGRATTDVPGTPQDEGDDPRGVLYGIDPADGSVAWGGPVVDVAHGCPAVSTSDDRIIAHDAPTSTTNPSNDAQLVAIDATTGDRMPGQVFNGELDDGGDRLRPCEAGQRLVLTDDESLVLVLSNSDNGRTVRAIDIDTWTEAWEVNLQDADANDSVPVVSPVLLTDDGDGFYVVYRWENTGDVATSVYRLERFSLADGSSDGFVDLPGSSQYAATGTASLTVEGGIVTTTGYCAGAPASAANDECVIRYADNAGTFTEEWVTYAPEDGGNNLVSSLARMDDDTIGGFSEAQLDGQTGLIGINLDTGAIEWTTRTPFSNNGAQFITDPDGNGYFGGFGEYHVRSVSPEGEVRWGIEHCHLVNGIEPRILGPIGYDGTLVTMVRDPDNDAKEVVRGFRTGADLPKGECPEQEERVEGATRVETSVEISNVSFENESDVVVLATSTNYPDALAGGPLARRLDAPLLLTEPGALSPVTRAEIERLGARTAVLLGGTVALSQAVEDELDDDMGLDVDRIAGGDRFETAQLISQRVPATTAYVTEGANADPNRGWPDAVAVSGLASLEQRPILLVTRDGVPDPTLQALDDLGATEVVVVGGETAVSASTASTLGASGATVTREWGPTRFGTSVAIAERTIAAGASTFDLWFATGLAFPDALAAGPAVAKANGVLLLVHGTRPDLGEEVYDFLASLDDTAVLRATFIGGTTALTNEVATALLDAAGIDAP